MVRDDNSESSSILNRALIEKGIEQLRKEITTLESWLQELDHAPAYDLEGNSLRIVYLDMIQSRKEMLSGLLQQQISV
jgi:hypothetical protein